MGVNYFTRQTRSKNRFASNKNERETEFSDPRVAVQSTTSYWLKSGIQESLVI